MRLMSEIANCWQLCSKLPVADIYFNDVFVSNIIPLSEKVPIKYLIQYYIILMLTENKYIYTYK